MAKSFRINEFGPNGSLKSNPMSRSFWEHWFDAQAQSAGAQHHPEKRQLWEDTVNFWNLALEEPEQ